MSVHCCHVQSRKEFRLTFFYKIYSSNDKMKCSSISAWNLSLLAARLVCLVYFSLDSLAEKRSILMTWSIKTDGEKKNQSVIIHKIECNNLFFRREKKTLIEFHWLSMYVETKSRKFWSHENKSRDKDQRGSVLNEEIWQDFTEQESNVELVDEGMASRVNICQISWYIHSNRYVLDVIGRFHLEKARR